MYIVGTSGHIDHGKTSLIKAMTGVDCDRLPEEKAREMTIDIGFSQIEYPKLGTVSIIDVPGHERFIRNMVVGASGIDLAILVIAVDDGWMPQTEDHYRVIELLGVERIIVALNKIDLVDQEMIEYVIEEVKERLEDTRFHDVDIVQVSSKTGKGIEELKEILKKNLLRLAKVFDADKPFLFIDRVFASKGYGSILTGTLKNGRFQQDDLVTLLPSKKEARIKRIESHNQELTQGNPAQRIALNLSGVSTDNLERGYIIIKNNFFVESNDFIAGIRLLDKGKKIKNNLGIEILIGTSSIKGKIIYIDPKLENDSVYPVRFKLDKPWFIYPGEPFIITNPGGYRIIGGGTVVLPSFNSNENKRKIRNNIDLLKNYTIEEILEFIIKIHNSIKLPIISNQLPDSEKNTKKIILKLIDKGAIIQVNEYLIDKEYYDEANTVIGNVIANNIGLNLKEISDISKIDFKICKEVLPIVVKNNMIIEKDGVYFSGDSITIDTLSDEKKKILSQTFSKSIHGIEVEKLDIEEEKQKIKELVRLGFLISLDGNIIYHRDVYKELKQKIINLFNDNDKITVADAREATGLSRKYIIPLLNRIESDGLIKRVGDFRIKV